MNKLKDQFKASSFHISDKQVSEPKKEFKIVEYIYVILGTLVGSVLGVLLPFVWWKVEILLGGDVTGAAALSFFPIVGIPLGAFIGGMVVHSIISNKNRKDNHSTSEKN